MSRNRIIYQSEALFSSINTGDSYGNVVKDLVCNLQRVTEISNNAEITRQNVNIFGRLSNLSREIIEEPTVSMDFTYYLADGFNESGIGLTTYRSAANASTNCLSGILANNGDSCRNFYVLTVSEGVDANGIDASGTAGYGIIGIGNGYISNYSVNGAVGEIPNASVSVEASNIMFANSVVWDGADLTTSGIQNPSVSVTGTLVTQYTGRCVLPIPSTGLLTTKVLRPGDIVMDFGTASLGMGGAVLPGMTTAATKNTAHIQSFTLDLPLSRTPQRRLGNAFAFSRELDVPIDVTLTVSANLADIDAGSLDDLVCGAETEKDITIKLYGPCGNGDESVLNMMYTLKGATLDSQNMSSNIGDPKTVELTFTSQVGGPNDQTKGLFISGRHGT